MALVAQRLALVGAYLYSSWTIEQLRHGKIACAEMQLLAAVIEGQRASNGCGCCGNALGWFGLCGAFAVHLVAGHAGHRRLIRKRCAYQMPRSCCVHRLHQVANRPVEVHAMATKAVIGETALSVVRWIREDLGIGGAVRAGMPRGVFVLMALLTLRCHRKHVGIAEMNCLTRMSREMYADVPQLGRKTCVMAVETGGGAVRRGMHSAGKRSHLVAARASLSMLRGVVVRRTVEKRNAQSRGGRDTGQAEAL